MASPPGANAAWLHALAPPVADDGDIGFYVGRAVCLLCQVVRRHFVHQLDYGSHARLQRVVRKFRKGEIAHAGARFRGFQVPVDVEVAAHV